MDLAQAKSFIGKCPYCKSEITGTVGRFLSPLAGIGEKLPHIIHQGDILSVPVVDSFEICRTNHYCKKMRIKSVIFAVVKKGKFLGFDAFVRP